MSFKGRNAPDNDDFYTSLANNPQPVAILDVGDLYEGEKEAQKYFYIKYMLCNTTQEQSVAYSVKYVDGTLIATEGSKIYPLVSFVSGLDDDEILFTKEDIDEALKDKTFRMRAKKQKGKTAWYKLIPLEDISEGA